MLAENRFSECRRTAFLLESPWKSPLIGLNNPIAQKILHKGMHSNITYISLILAITHAYVHGVCVCAIVLPLLSSILQCHSSKNNKNNNNNKKTA